MPEQYNNVLLFDRMATRAQEEPDDTKSQRIFFPSLQNSKLMASLPHLRFPKCGLQS